MTNLGGGEVSSILEYLAPGGDSLPDLGKEIMRRTILNPNNNAV